mgnify:CR=1 FL=1
MAGQVSQSCNPGCISACWCMCELYISWRQAPKDTHKKRELVTRFMLKVQSQRMKVTMPHKMSCKGQQQELVTERRSLCRVGRHCAGVGSIGSRQNVALHRWTGMFLNSGS